MTSVPEHPTPSPIITADNYFAIVPEWVLDADLTGNAVKLYAILRRHADKVSEEAYPSRRRLAERMRFSRTASVDPIIRELVDVGAVEVFERWTPRGDRDSNGYRVISARPYRVGSETAPPVVAETDRPVVRETVQKLESLEPESLELDGASVDAAEAPKPKSRRSPSTPFPEGMPPNEANLAFATEHGLDIRHEYTQFKAHALANDRRLVNWQQGLRMWLGNAAARLPKNNAPAGIDPQKAHLFR